MYLLAHPIAQDKIPSSLRVYFLLASVPYIHAHPIALDKTVTLWASYSLRTKVAKDGNMDTNENGDIFYDWQEALRPETLVGFLSCDVINFLC